MRVRCKACRITHAIIPSFSLSGTSIGTEEGEKYAQNREKGQSRKEAAQAFEGKKLSDSYPKQFDKMLEVAIIRAKALLSLENIALRGLKWIKAVVGTEARPLHELNCFCLRHNVNAVCFNRFTILDFRTRKAGSHFSLNNSSIRSGRKWLDSS